MNKKVKVTRQQGPIVRPVVPIFFECVGLFKIPANGLYDDPAALQAYLKVFKQIEFKIKQEGKRSEVREG